MWRLDTREGRPRHVQQAIRVGRLVTLKPHGRPRTRQSGGPRVSSPAAASKQVWRKNTSAPLNTCTQSAAHFVFHFVFHLLGTPNTAPNPLRVTTPAIPHREGKSQRRAQRAKRGHAPPPTSSQCNVQKRSNLSKMFQHLSGCLLWTATV